MPDEGGAFLNDDAHGLEITQEFGVRLKLATLLDGHIAIYRAMDRDRLGADFAFDDGVFAERENTFGDDLAVELAIKNHFAVELERAGELDIAGEDVFRSGGFRNQGGDVVKVHVERDATRFQSKGSTASRLKNAAS